VKVLFLTAHSRLAASARFRVYQYLDYLRERGLEADVRPFVSDEVFSLIRSNGKLARKARLFAARGLSRFRDLRVARDYDVVFVQRESFPVGPAWVERYLAKQGCPIVFDFDDAIYLPRPNALGNFLRNPSKTAEIVQLASHVIVSTEQLRGFAAAYNPNVSVIPTSVDTDVEYRKRQYSESVEPSAPVRVGWIGSLSTAGYLERLVPVLSRVAARRRVEFLVMGAGRELAIRGARTHNLRWSIEAEADGFRSLDIGVYPLDDGVWERGKGGFKAIQYMAAAVPCVVSPVGVVRHIVQDGEHGFHARSSEEWEDRLVRLVDDAGLRRRLGEAGRLHCERSFSVRVSAPRLLEVLEAAARRGRRPIGRHSGRIEELKVPPIEATLDRG